MLSFSTKYILLNISALCLQGYDTWPPYVLMPPNVLRDLSFSSLIPILSRAVPEGVPFQTLPRCLVSDQCVGKWVGGVVCRTNFLSVTSLSLPSWRTGSSHLFSMYLLCCLRYQAGDDGFPSRSTSLVNTSQHWSPQTVAWSRDSAPCSGSPAAHQQQVNLCDDVQLQCVLASGTEDNSSLTSYVQSLKVIFGALRRKACHFN